MLDELCGAGAGAELSLRAVGGVCSGEGTERSRVVPVCSGRFAPFATVPVFSRGNSFCLVWISLLCEVPGLRAWVTCLLPEPGVCGYMAPGLALPHRHINYIITTYDRQTFKNANPHR